MKIQSYKYPKSSFLSVEKDMNIIVDQIIKNNQLKKMLYYTSKDCLDKPNLTEDQTLELFGKQIKIVPKLHVDKQILNYIIISFNNFQDNVTNPEFRNNLVIFDVVCHFDQWQMNDFQLRPYKIAAELDSMLRQQRLTGLGELVFLEARQVCYTDEFAGLCIIYAAVHGEEDRKHMPNPAKEQEFIDNFDAIFNS